MRVTKEELARRLRSAREALGMTQEEAASRFGASRATLAQMEAGNRPVSSLELDKLAGIYGRDIGDFVAPEYVEDDALRALLRAEPGFELTPDLRSALVSWRNKGRALSDLEKLIGMPQRLCTAAIYATSLPSTRWDAIQQGEQVGHEERARLGLGRAPLPDLPELLESQGVRTAVENLPDHVSGMTLLGRDHTVLVVVNENHPPLRRRFSFAHECAHVLLDRSRGGVVSRIEDRNDAMEIRANAFAAALLMPSDGVLSFVQDLGKGGGSRLSADVYHHDDTEAPVRVEARSAPRSQDIQMYDVIQLARHFRVSQMAMVYRLKNLRLITQGELDVLKRQEEQRYVQAMAGAFGDKANEDAESPSAFRRRFISCSMEAYRRALISKGKFVELLRLVDVDEAGVERLEDVTRSAGEIG